MAPQKKKKTQYVSPTIEYGNTRGLLDPHRSQEGEITEGKMSALGVQTSLGSGAVKHTKKEGTFSTLCTGLP